MPQSNHENREPVINILKRESAQFILDLGVGWGEWGRLLKDLIPGCVLYGIEVFLPYFDTIPKEMYSQLLNEDMRYVDYSRVGKQDAVILIDSLEHLTRGDGIELLWVLEEKFPLVVVSVPIITSIQSEVLGNIHETHKTQWKLSQMIKLGYEVEFIGKECGVFFKKNEI